MVALLIPVSYYLVHVKPSNKTAPLKITRDLGWVKFIAPFPDCSLPKAFYSLATLSTQVSCFTVVIIVDYNLGLLLLTKHFVPF